MMPTISMMNNLVDSLSALFMRSIRSLNKGCKYLVQVLPIDLYKKIWLVKIKKQCHHQKEKKWKVNFEVLGKIK